MADTEEDGQTEPRRGKMTSSESKPKFKDPLMNTADGDSDDGEMESLDLDASGKSELSVSRSSSLIANLSGYGDDADDPDSRDLFIAVDDPEKHSSTMDSYVTFRVSVRTTRSEYDTSEYHVRRRYNDFLWLRQKLETTRSEYDTSEYHVRRRYNDFLWLRQKLEVTYATHLVPPLPEKHSLRRLDRFSPEFLRVRQVALQKFLTRLADHPVLSFDRNFQIFLTTKAHEFQAHKKQHTGILGRVSDSIHNMGTSYMMKNRIPEFTTMHEYITTFGEKLASMDRITARVAKEQGEFHVDMSEWGPIYTLWANSEDQLVSALLSMSKAVDTCCQSLKELIDSTDDNFTQPMKEYALYAEAIKAVLRRRDAIQSEYDSTLDELNKKKDEREQLKISDQTYSLGAFLGKDPDEVKQQKQDKLEQQIVDLTKQMEVLNDKTVCSDTDLKADMERWHRGKHKDMFPEILASLTKQMEVLNDKTVCSDTDLKADMERWHRGKHKDMRELLVAWADRNILYYEKCLKTWEDTIRAIQCKDPPADGTTTEPTDTTSKEKDDVSLEHTESTETDKTESDLS